MLTYAPNLASGNISTTSGKQFPIVTSTPGLVSVVFRQTFLLKLHYGGEKLGTIGEGIVGL